MAVTTQKTTWTVTLSGSDLMQLLRKTYCPGAPPEGAVNTLRHCGREINKTDQVVLEISQDAMKSPEWKG